MTITTHDEGLPGDPDVLERIALRMAACLDVEELIRLVTERLVRDYDTALARIWLTGPGDLCATCRMREACEDRTSCLHLRASAGLSSNLDGNYRRMPFGEAKIGQIAARREAHWTNAVMQDPRVASKAWAREHALRCFAGYPLVHGGRLLGVFGLFRRERLTAESFRRLTIFSQLLAIQVANAERFATERSRRHRAERLLQIESTHETDVQQIAGRSAAIQALLGSVQSVAASDAPVLLRGERGTGKRHVARAIHDLSSRRDGPFLTVDAGLLPRDRGTAAFLDETEGKLALAHGGTLHVMHAEALAPDLQEALFDVLSGAEPTHADVRLIASTTVDLDAEVDAGRFRKDLAYRLSRHTLAVPSLRERLEDLPELIDHFMERAAERLRVSVKGLAPGEIDALGKLPWRGNLSELRNLVERAALGMTDGLIRLSDLAVGDGDEEPSMESLVAVERSHIQHILERTQWTIEGPGGAAEVLDLAPSTLRSRMSKLGIRRP